MPSWEPAGSFLSVEHWLATFNPTLTTGPDPFEQYPLQETTGFDLTALMDRDSHAPSTSPQAIQHFDPSSPPGTPPSTQSIASPTAPSSPVDPKRRLTCLQPGCGRSFRSNGHLQRHQMTHTKERPFTCDFPDCGRSFARKDNMQQHRVVHATDADRRASGRTRKRPPPRSNVEPKGKPVDPLAQTRRSGSGGDTTKTETTEVYRMEHPLQHLATSVPNGLVIIPVPIPFPQDAEWVHGAFSPSTVSSPIVIHDEGPPLLHDDPFACYSSHPSTRTLHGCLPFKQEPLARPPLLPTRIMSDAIVQCDAHEWNALVGTPTFEPSVAFGVHPGHLHPSVPYVSHDLVPESSEYTYSPPYWPVVQSHSVTEPLLLLHPPSHPLVYIPGYQTP
ncbi:hypothetical protein HKX48_006356 [Thoreauomyces humboldtii]|nr:hypothetical protein HKX48_006356 [Thoreauomyces humboldtii]